MSRHRCPRHICRNRSPPRPADSVWPPVILQSPSFPMSSIRIRSSVLGNDSAAEEHPEGEEKSIALLFLSSSSIALPLPYPSLYTRDTTRQLREISSVEEHNDMDACKQAMNGLSNHHININQSIKSRYSSKQAKREII